MKHRRLLVFVAASAALVIVPATAASAHPLGNFSINTATAIRVEPDAIVVEHAADDAEIPTLQVKPSIDTNGDGNLDPQEQDAYLANECARVAQGVHLAVDDHRLALEPDPAARSMALVDGLAGLPTMRVLCTLRAATSLGSGSHSVTVDDTYLTDRVGWHEVSASGDRTTLTQSDVPATSPSASLTRYPADRVQSPVSVRHASLRVAPGGAPVSVASPSVPAAADRAHSAVPGVDHATRAFTGLVARRDLTVEVGTISVLVALVLGAFHALAPGHGKTVMAAYLVGQRGTLRQALAVGGSVTVTHTAGVLVLGLVLSVSAVVAPERVYPWLGALSGAFLAAIGAALLGRAIRLRRAGVEAVWHTHGPPGHAHDHAHENAHHHAHAHGHAHHHDDGHGRHHDEHDH